MESDPKGLKANEPGAKLDNGKPRAGLVLKGFGLALLEVSKVGTFGANKYTEHGWISVENGQARYEDAQMRHFLISGTEETDDQSTLSHMAHEAWNALAKLELKLREEKNIIKKQEDTIYLKVQVTNLAIDEKPYITYVREEEWPSYQKEMHEDGNPMTSWEFNLQGEYQLKGGEWVRL